MPWQNIYWNNGHVKRVTQVALLNPEGGTRKGVEVRARDLESLQLA